MLSYTGFAQNTSTNAAQEALDFMRSPQGTAIVHRVQILTFASFGKVSISNELVRVSTNATFSLPIRQFAAETLRTYDNSATNSYQEIESFIMALPFTEEPPMTTNTIVILKRSLEIGSSAFTQLHSYQSDTNIPILYREYIGMTITNIINAATD